MCHRKFIQLEDGLKIIIESKNDEDVRSLSSVVQQQVLLHIIQNEDISLRHKTVDNIGLEKTNITADLINENLIQLQNSSFVKNSIHDQRDTSHEISDLAKIFADLHEDDILPAEKNVGSATEICSLG